VVALASRGHCTFVSKAIRAQRAGALGLLLVDNRPGEANAIPLQLPIAAGMIADLDGARLRAYLATTGGRAPVTISNIITRDETGRSGVITSFSSAGPTAFAHLLKPDLSAPAARSSRRRCRSSPAVTVRGLRRDEHVGAARIGRGRLLVQLHPGWSAQEVKSALMSTAGAPWSDTARTQEAPVTLGGAGLVDLPRAAQPQVFTQPASLSFQRLDVNHGATAARCSCA
jgi:hypothetical protein